MKFYVVRNSGQKVFVKEGNFFEQQGGLKESWGDEWVEIDADSIEHARRLGEAILPLRPESHYNANKFRK